MNDAVYKIMEDTRSALRSLQRGASRMSAARKEAAKVKLLNTVNGCVGELAKCQSMLERNIFLQAADVREGMEKGFDTAPPEQILWDSAIGYMLADEAIFALGGIAGYDDLNRAYASMEAIIKRITGEESGTRSNVRKKDGFGVKRDISADIVSQERLEKHEKMLNTFFDDLIRTGNFVDLLTEARKKEYENRMKKIEQVRAEPEADTDEPEIVDIDAPVTPEPQKTEEEPDDSAKKTKKHGLFSKPEVD